MCHSICRDSIVYFVVRLILGFACLGDWVCLFMVYIDLLYAKSAHSSTSYSTEKTYAMVFVLTFHCIWERVPVYTSPATMGRAHLVWSSNLQGNTQFLVTIPISRTLSVGSLQLWVSQSIIVKLCTLTATQHRDLGSSFPCIIRLELAWPRSQDANLIREYASIRGFWYETVYSISNTNIWISAMLLILFYSCWFSLGSWYL